MSQQDVEIVRRVHDALARRDNRTVLALYHPEIEMEFSRSPFADFMQEGRVQRHEGVRSAFRDWYDAWEGVETDVEELIDAGQQVISVFTYRGRGRASGVEVEWKRMAGVWTIREGKVVGVVWLRTRDEALEAAGLAG
jgi:ketosteroid isomerase-like protein